MLYLGGLGRSGTTLVERVLAGLPGVCPLGEVVHLWQRDLRDDERCGCGARFSACGFWHAVGAAAFAGWSNVDVEKVLRLQATVERTRRIPRLAGNRLGGVQLELVREYADYYARVYRAAAQVTGVDVVIDSSKHSALAYCLRFAGIDLRVAHIVRDPRGVAYSWTKTVPRPESDGRREMTRYSPGRSALLWSAHNAAFDLLRRRGVPVMRVQYEEFVADPRGVTRQLGTFAGLDLTTDPLDFLTEHSGQMLADLPPMHSAAGNPMRFLTGRVPLQRDDGWRAALPAAQRRLVGAIASPLLGAYGYHRRSTR